MNRLAAATIYSIPTLIIESTNTRNGPKNGASDIPKNDAVPLLTVLAVENVIRAFEISVPKGKWQVAMKELTAEMRLGTQYGADVFTAAKDAQDALSGSRGVNWITWGAIGVGAAAIVVATGGLALAAAPALPALR